MGVVGARYRYHREPRAEWGDSLSALNVVIAPQRLALIGSDCH